LFITTPHIKVKNNLSFCVVFLFISFLFLTLIQQNDKAMKNSKDKSNFLFAIQEALETGVTKEGINASFDSGYVLPKLLDIFVQYGLDQNILNSPEFIAEIKEKSEWGLMDGYGVDEDLNEFPYVGFDEIVSCYHIIEVLKKYFKK
jgi:hypothetical protein